MVNIAEFFDNYQLHENYMLSAIDCIITSDLSDSSVFVFLQKKGADFSQKEENRTLSKMLSRLIVQSQPMLSMTLAGRNIQKMPIRHQIIRQFKNDSRETVTRAERISQRSQTLKEKIMAPAGPNGNYMQ